MELSNPQIFKTSHFTPNSLNYSSLHKFRKPQSRKTHKIHQFFPQNFPLSPSFPRNFQISAHFQRHSTRRRNSLRKKIADEQQKKVQIGNDFVQIHNKDSKFDEMSLEKSNLLSNDSILFGEFENWDDDQYKKDTEFVVSGRNYTGFVNELRNVVLRPEMVSKLSRVGFMMFCSLVLFTLVKKVRRGGKNSRVELTREEKRMLERKKKARMERDELENESVEVLPKKIVSPLIGSVTRPELDKQELMGSIAKAMGTGEEVKLMKGSRNVDDGSRDFDDRVKEIKEMARHVRDIEVKDRKEYEDVHEELSKDLEQLELYNDLSNADSLKHGDINATREPPSDVNLPTVDIEGSGDETRIQWDSSNGKYDSSHPVDAKRESQSYDSSEEVPSKADDCNGVGIGLLHEGASVHDSDDKNSQSASAVPTVKGSGSGIKKQQVIVEKKSNSSELMVKKEDVHPSDAPIEEAYNPTSSSPKVTPKIILSVKEAKEYLSRKHETERCTNGRSPRLVADAIQPSSTDEEVHVNSRKTMPSEKELYKSSILGKKSSNNSIIKPSENFSQMKTDSDIDVLRSNSLTSKDSSSDVPLKSEDPDDVQEKFEMDDFQRSVSFEEYSGIDRNGGATPFLPKESWLEKNFQDFEPIVKKIGDGFRENYMVAKEKVRDELNLRSELDLPADDGELDWMKDDSLREIVFQVRENELMGREPFHMMDAKDKQAFFKGLEEKAEKASVNLAKLHEWVHSKIENLDYGADGISLHDPPEKVIPRWKGSTVAKDPEFLNRRKGSFDGNNNVSHPLNPDLHDTRQNSASSAGNNVLSSSITGSSRVAPKSGDSKNPKTLIESSDGSSRAGKKSGKEFWQHTKKWSREFLELYNTETDPEVKSIMKDMGKDLNRWISDKEIQETADLMTKIPKKKRKYIEKKLKKLKREMEMFGPQAVVSKYREYGEEEEDYLWWLDLPFVLCIELYTNEYGDQKIGFYSLEMAEDLELDPKQYHVIAFEDPGDSKSFCYIMQAHLEMLGKGNAFVVARPPKDAFREAKANGFSVTVIRKGELQLNVDKTLEEVEEQISEIGSKVYHDKIFQERGVDMGSLMKGVFGSNKPIKREKSKRILKKPSASEQ